MAEALQAALQALASLPPVILYLVLGAGAAAENVVPVVPADTFVLAGAILAARGAASAWTVFAVTWSCNVVLSAGVYLVARRHGQAFFKMPLARWLLRPHQLERVAAFYRRWGLPAIFLGRFLPAWRSLVPVFAGVSGVRAARALPPVALASAAWYGLLVYLGVLAGHNLEAIARIVGDVSGVLLGIALVLIAGLAAWWWRSRHHPEGR